MLKGVTILNSYDIITPEWNDKIFPAVVFTCIAIAGIVGFVLVLKALMVEE